LGIVGREDGEGRPTLRVCDTDLEQACGRYVTVASPYVAAHVTADVERLADVLVIPVNYNGDPEALQDVEAGPGLWVRRVGKGTVVYSAPNLFATYLHKPTSRLMRLVRTLLVHLVPPVVTLDGPQAVRVNTRVQPDGRWTIHLHNAPGTAYRYPAPKESNYLHTPGEVLPVHDLRLFVNGPGIRRAWLGMSRESLPIEVSAIRVPRLGLHEVIVVETERGQPPSAMG
jgi:hypothetical protein